MGKVIDLVGQEFGKLTVIERMPTHISPKGKHVIEWLCQCECGNYTIVTASSLRSGHTKSCGCLRKENMQNRPHGNFISFENTSITAIRKNTLHKNSTSGHAGVSWDKNGKKWRASIKVKRIKYHLGSFKEIEDAIKARKDAEEHYWKPILERYEKTVI